MVNYKYAVGDLVRLNAKNDVEFFNHVRWQRPADGSPGLDEEDFDCAIMPSMVGEILRVEECIEMYVHETLRFPVYRLQLMIQTAHGRIKTFYPQFEDDPIYELEWAESWLVPYLNKAKPKDIFKSW